jgi:hypothetical protein
MLRKKTTYTNVTAIPSHIPRQLAVDLLHSHGEIIELNPLVTGFEPIKAPRDAPADEFYSTWYEIAEKIQYIPGVGKMGAGHIKFRGCFHDMPWGLQTHMYITAPANVDLRNKWQICGNQPGEPVQTPELGIGAPPEGLYLREDIEIKCNVTMVGFVKKETKAASKVLVDRLIKKAELLDSGALSAMMENGKLKTLNPADRSSAAAQRPQSSQHSPNQHYNVPTLPTRSNLPNEHMYGQPPNHAQAQNHVVMELPGDYYYHPQSSPNLLQPNDHRGSTASALSGHSPNSSDGRWSHVSNDYQSSNSSRPSSFASDGLRSPGMDQKGFAAELPTMQETREESQHAQQYPEDRKYRYNPQDYANTQQYPQSQQYSQQSQYNQPPQYSSYNTGR